MGVLAPLGRSGEGGQWMLQKRHEVISSLSVFCETKVLNFGEKKRKRNLLSRGKAGVYAGPSTWQRGQGRNTEEAAFQIRWYTGLVEAYSEYQNSHPRLREAQ